MAGTGQAAAPMTREERAWVAWEKACERAERAEAERWHATLDAVRAREEAAALAGEVVTLWG